MPPTPFDELARRWVPGEGPMEIRPLTSGLVNESCRVSRAGNVYSLRVAAANSDDLGFDRDWECKVLEEAAAAGIAPTVEYCDPLQGVLVAGWVSGRVWTTEELRRSANIDAMAQLLRRVHALEIPQPARAMDPGAWIAQYSAALSRRGVAAMRSGGLRDAAEARLVQVAQCASPAVLCHSDLHRQNVLVGDRPVLLDWEYAHVSNAYWDLAGWAANNDWTERETGRLLSSYMQRPSDAEERRRLEVWAWLYDYVCLLWCELYVSQRPEAVGHIAARADILAGRLERAQRGAMPGA